MAESLTAFVLISLMLMLYLPSFYTELERLRLAEQQTREWQVFHELVLIELNETMSPNVKEQEIMMLKERYAQYDDTIVEFFCTQTQCYIRFGRGSEWHETWE